MQYVDILVLLRCIIPMLIIIQQQVFRTTSWGPRLEFLTSTSGTKMRFMGKNLKTMAEYNVEALVIDAINGVYGHI